MAQDNFRQSFYEANHALLEAHSLANIGQEAYNDFESDNIYNLLGVIDDKINIVLDFFNNNEFYLEGIEKKIINHGRRLT